MRTLFLTFLMSWSVAVNAQKDSTINSPAYTKNAIHVSAGTWFFYGEWNVNYERIFTKLDNTKSDTYVGGQFGFGVSESFSHGTHYTPTAKVVLLSGNSRSHFEFNGGASINLLEMDGALPQGHVVSIYTPTFSIGYRFQNMTNSRFVFRTGVGWPTGLYLGCGINF